ncbi:hypothetical protein FRC12_019086 [Ceratobasidium sp. 428]|nr:hypothetical protein FRC12_019086 [Ceratobasidium sp. 428]
MSARELEFEALQEAAARLGLQLTPANNLPPPVNDAAPPYAPNDTTTSVEDPKVATAPSKSQLVQPPPEPPATQSKGTGRAKPRMRTALSENQVNGPVPASTTTPATGLTVISANAPRVTATPATRAAPTVPPRVVPANTLVAPVEPAAPTKSSKKGPSATRAAHPQ